MSLVRWDPFREMNDLVRRYAPFFNESLPGETPAWKPTANISETANEYLIKAELPEVSKDDVKITLDNDVLTISGERRLDKEDQNQHQLRVESFYGTFSRSFALPSNVDTSKIAAESKDGVLRVHLPKAEVSKPKAIQIEVK